MITISRKTGVLVGLALLFFTAFKVSETIPFAQPEGWPEPVYDFQKNPLTKAKIELGRHLFYDPILSRDNSISCSSCHLQYTAFTHIDHELSHGIKDRVGQRNSPALMNLAWGDLFMWDGSVNHLDMQALAPITDHNEMDEKIENVIKKLQATTKYPALFQTAFGDSLITGEHLLKAISQFELTLVSANAKYDKVMRKEEGVVFTEQEEKGYKLFKKNCNSCHQEPLFTTNEFAYNGLPIDSSLMDFGRIKITKNPEDSLKFKIPTLRNIEFSYPFMHDGRTKRLWDVLKHYEEGIVETETLAPQLKGGIKLSSVDKMDLIAFLLTLSDKEFLFNPNHSFPRQ